MSYVLDIVSWRIKASEWDIYAFDSDVTHKEVLELCFKVNRYFEEMGSVRRVRKSWKSIEACWKGEEDT